MPVRTLTEAVSTAPTLDGRGTGRMLIQIMSVGEGSSAHYPAEALEAAAMDRIWPAGTHMYLDHADERRRGPHGERSVRDLASVLTTDAAWDANRQALVAEAQVMDGMESTMESLAPHVGLSISANAEVDPPTVAGGKPVVRRFLAAESVDWVTKAGRGGAVLQILESAGIAEVSANDTRVQLRTAVAAAVNDGSWVRDYDPDAGLVWYEADEKVWQQAYTTSASGTVSLSGERAEVRVVTQYVPVTSTAGVTETDKEKNMPEIDQAELDRLKALEAENAANLKRAEEAEAKIAASENASKVAEARKAVTAKVAEAAKDLPAPMRERITAQVVATVEADVPADIDTQITSAVTAERAYMASLTESAGLTGFGSTTTTTTTPKRTTNAFGRTIEGN